VPIQNPVPEFDLYAELGVAFDADRRMIEAAWRRQVRANHPDRVLSDDDRTATGRTARLNIAREWLSDASKRARYDSLRRPTGGPEPMMDPLAAWPTRPPARALAVGPSLWIPAAVAGVVMVVVVGMGVGTNPLTVGAFALSMTMLVYYGLMGFFTIVRRQR
jgi:hypothetical protein